MVVLSIYDMTRLDLIRLHLINVDRLNTRLRIKIPWNRNNASSFLYDQLSIEWLPYSQKVYTFSNSIHACKLFYFGILHTYIRRFLFTFRHSPDRWFRFMNITHSPSTCVDLIISHNSTVRVVAYKVNIIICYPHLEKLPYTNIPRRNKNHSPILFCWILSWQYSSECSLLMHDTHLRRIITICNIQLDIYWIESQFRI